MNRVLDLTLVPAKDCLTFLAMTLAVLSQQAKNPRSLKNLLGELNKTVFKPSNTFS